MDKNDNPNQGMRGDDDDRSGGGSGDEDVFIQAAALAGELNQETTTGKYHVVDENGAVSCRMNIGLINVSFRFVEKTSTSNEST